MNLVRASTKPGGSDLGRSSREFVFFSEFMVSWPSSPGIASVCFSSLVESTLVEAFFSFCGGKMLDRDFMKEPPHDFRSPPIDFLSGEFTLTPFFLGLLDCVSISFASEIIWASVFGSPSNLSDSDLARSAPALSAIPSSSAFSNLDSEGDSLLPPTLDCGDSPGVEEGSGSSDLLSSDLSDSSSGVSSDVAILLCDTECSPAVLEKLGAESSEDAFAFGLSSPIIAGQSSFMQSGHFLRTTTQSPSSVSRLS
mmetsp:Transcript_39679/g.69734  ORF Transcript_39679/g.69734 Transcript_39679/m.69734 type:complete len:253 (+) Transcript_39679:567-1325(+)